MCCDMQLMIMQATVRWDGQQHSIVEYIVDATVNRIGQEEKRTERGA